MDLPTAIDDPDFVLTRATRTLGFDDRALRRAVDRGEFVRLHRGVFLRAAEWSAVPRRERYRTRVRAVAAALRSAPTLSHHSAAAVWGVPLVHEPRDVHVLTALVNGTRSAPGVRRHATPALSSHVVVRDGVAVTDLERTLVEFASSVPFRDAVVALDWALRLPTAREPKPFTTPDAVRAVADELQLVRGARRLEVALDFADGRSGSPGETISRIDIRELGFPKPELQVAFVDRDGLIGRSDFGWDGLAGEFDGRIKYTRGVVDDRPIEDVVFAEKVREDRIRACGVGVVRWLWSDLEPASRLAAKLTGAGLRPKRR